jgi:hypothetical protein
MNGQFKFEVLADCQQFYVHDATADLALLDWEQEDCDRLLAVAPGVLGVGTVREGFVSVVLELSEDQPSEDLNEWDQVNECSLEITSGELVVADVFYVANSLKDRKINLMPSVYKARLHYGNLASVTGGGVGEDHYKVVLWRAATCPLRVLKQASSQRIRWSSFVGDSFLSGRRTM